MLESSTNNLNRSVGICKPEGLYTIIYGAHSKKTNLALLPETLDGIVMEWPSYTGSGQPGYMNNSGRLLLPQLSTVLEHAEGKKLPVYHTDLELNKFFWLEMFLPAQPSTWFRNVVMAHKGEWLMKNVEGMRHLCMVLGADHNGIENQLRKTREDRIKSLQHLSILLKAISRRKTIPSISRYDFNGIVWQLGEVFEVQDLKDI